ncbi:type VI secretion system tube protein Hcp, partial [Pseudomonas aeruginosa]|nr:type VI secretion system tube protein Hcp [Pseudomonas aeruginosa]MCS9223140.1 type VI secretion system tube protein Hcp [Pseudomonas aeruginosa]MCS9703947.1 type VI secretion system tube protein Hcp [Pseudomonas aeruginosa]MCS9710358.1 type VI secretion system tube protein Hcp [Pseudomonas aeruginosa]MCS9796872.1 type VI secretion system tube protein Hcp [Pseudomonas aeruginosa]
MSPGHFQRQGTYPWQPPAYMSITGTKQGLITAGAFTEDSVGNTYQEGHEDQVMVQGFNHEVIIP